MGVQKLDISCKEQPEANHANSKHIRDRTVDKIAEDLKSLGVNNATGENRNKVFVKNVTEFYSSLENRRQIEQEIDLLKDVLKSLDQSVLNALETIQPHFTLTIHGFIADIIKIAYGLGRWQYKSHLDSDFYTSYLRIKGNEQTNEIQKAKASGWHE